MMSSEAGQQQTATRRSQRPTTARGNRTKIAKPQSFMKQ